jgi:hypothetical protein
MEFVLSNFDRHPVWNDLAGELKVPENQTSISAGGPHTIIILKG